MCSICKKYLNRPLSYDEKRAALAEIAKSMAYGSKSDHFSKLLDVVTDNTLTERDLKAEAAWEKANKPE